MNICIKSPNAKRLRREYDKQFAKSCPKGCLGKHERLYHYFHYSPFHDGVVQIEKVHVNPISFSMNFVNGELWDVLGALPKNGKLFRTNIHFEQITAISLHANYRLMHQSFKFYRSIIRKFKNEYHLRMLIENIENQDEVMEIKMQFGRFKIENIKDRIWPLVRTNYQRKIFSKYYPD